MADSGVDPVRVTVDADDEVIGAAHRVMASALEAVHETSVHLQAERLYMLEVARENLQREYDRTLRWFVSPADSSLRTEVA